MVAQVHLESIHYLVLSGVASEMNIQNFAFEVGHIIAQRIDHSHDLTPDRIVRVEHVGRQICNWFGLKNGLIDQGE
jgi:hypothetical protein